MKRLDVKLTKYDMKQQVHSEALAYRCVNVSVHFIYY
jgi:hypothetical protein